MAGLRVNPEWVARFQEDDETPTNPQMALRLGVDRTTTYRVLNGQQAPSHKFIAGFIKAFGAQRLLDVFDVVDDK